jgi:hypothetical protein
LPFPLPNVREKTPEKSCSRFPGVCVIVNAAPFRRSKDDELGYFDAFARFLSSAFIIT